MTTSLLAQKLVPRLLGTTLLAAGVVLIAKSTGAMPPLIAIGLAAGVGTVIGAAALIHLGLSIRAARGAGNACRGVGLLGLAALAGGAALAVLPLVTPDRRGAVVAAGTAVAAALSASGLLLLPGIAASPMARLRRGLDGLSVAVCLTLAGWLLLPGIAGAPPRTYVVGALAVGFASVAAVIVLRALRYRPAALRCGAGAVSTVSGLAVLAAQPDLAAPPSWTALAALAVVTGPVVSWTGARRSGRPSVDPVEAAAAGFPLLTVPVAVAGAAMLHHLMTAGAPDRTAAALAVAAGATLVLRELLATADVRRYARRLAAQEAQLRALVAGASDVTVLLDGRYRVRWLSPAGLRQFGLSDPEVVGRRFTDLVHPDDAASVADRLRAVTTTAGEPGPAGADPVLLEARLIDGFGQVRETESTVSDQRETPGLGAVVLHVRDVGERRQLERTVRRLASTDRLTGLPDRRELVRTIRTRWSAGHRSGALLVLQVHGVNVVNAGHGRSAGDAALVEAALRMRTHVGTGDLVARLDGARFGVVTADGPFEAYALGMRLLTVMSEPFRAPADVSPIGASAGLAELSAGGDPDEVLRRADLARQRAAHHGRGRIEWYDDSLERQLLRRTDLERFLPGAAGRGELDLVFQPVLELSADRPVGVEALLRWRHPVLGSILPGELLPVADRLRLSSEIGHWVLHTACQLTGGWRRDGHDLRLAVNVTAQQLAETDFVPEVAAALSVHQTPPERLTVELAEAEVVEALDPLADQLGRLRALGVRTALDDVSGSHASLEQLRRLPLDLLKLPVPAGGQAGSLFAAGVDVARRLGLEVVAEGIETSAQLTEVRRAGARYGQGRLLAEPAPAERIEAYLDLHRSPTV